MRSPRGPVEVLVGPKSAFPVLLLLLATLGCRVAALGPPAVFCEDRAPEELRIYAVADLLGKFDQVPKRGCCVMPYPAPTVVVFPRSWLAGQGGQAPVLSGGGGQRDAARRRSLDLRVSAAKAEERRSREAMNTERSPVLEEPGEALLDHLRSRLAGGDPAAAPLMLSMRTGSDLVARGSPDVLELLERALAELR